MILGDSGTGKSTSMRNLDPSQTLLIQAVRKPLPFRPKGWQVKLSLNAPGNIIQTDDADKIEAAMRRSTQPVIVIDDFQYILANEFMRRSDERGFDKFTEIGRHAWNVMRAASELADDRRVYILAHTATDEGGRTKMKTIGKMLDEKVTPEGLFTIVLRTAVRDGVYLFGTQNSGNDTSKSPMGMFSDMYIDNDLAAVDAAICEYWGITTPTTDAENSAHLKAA